MSDLVVPEGAPGVVLFAHGSGSGRHSPRNRYVAEVLQKAGLATALVDLLTEEEEQEDMRTRALRFDIGLLTERVCQLVDRLVQDERTKGLPVGLFGASTGAAAALAAATDRPEAVGAVVSRGGRVDLAGEALSKVRQPTLLLVGERDDVVLRLNKEALPRLAGDAELIVVPGATHLFEEPGALDQVAERAAAWFTTHLPAA